MITSFRQTNQIIRIFALTIFLILPVYLVRFGVGNGASINLLDFLLILSILFTLQAKRDNLTVCGFKSSIKNNALFSIFLALFLLWVTLSYLFNVSGENWTDGLGMLKSFYVLPIVFALGLGVLAKEGIVRLNEIFLAIFVGTSSVAVAGFFAVLAGEKTYDGRLDLIYDSPNHLAMVLGVGIVVGTWLALKEVAFLRKLLKTKGLFFSFFLWLLIVFHIIALYFTFSLGGWLSILGGVFAVYVSCLFKKYFRFFVYSILVFALLCSFLAFGANLILANLGYSESVPATAVDSRIAIYEATQKIILLNPVWGVGIGNFQQSYLESQKYFTPFPQWAVPHAHNALMQVGAQGGVFSIILFVVLLIIVINNYSRKRKKGSLFLILLVYFLLFGIVDNPIEKNDLAVIFWLVIVFLGFNFLGNKKQTLGVRM